MNSSASFRTTILIAGALFLSGLPCRADSRTEALLERAGRQVELFWEQVPSFTCTETVVQEKISAKGKTEYRQESVFDYLALTGGRENTLTVEELRLLQKKARLKPSKPPLLDTNGFPTLLLIFHPAYRASFQFELADGSAAGPVRQVRFEHIAGTRSTSALMTRGKVYPLDLRGTAWIEAESGAIQKISANLVSPMKEINIESFGIEVAYAPLNLPADASPRWLPSSAVIELRTARQHWRNSHLYSRYKRFTVQSVETVSK